MSDCIRFSTNILRRLGEELNPTVDRGIIELVKNAYDANATECTVAIKNLTKPGGTIIVTDNGDGMTASGIRSGWLVVGDSDKSKSRLTRLGRIPSGSKGLGRLAALRLGRQVDLATNPYKKQTTSSVHLDWDEFDRAKLVDDVELKIYTKKRPSGVSPGTKVVISDLRSHVPRMQVKRLARELLLLADPFRVSESAFRPKLLLPEFKDLQRLVERSYFEHADYHLVASVNRQGRAFAKVKDWRGRILFSAKHDELARNRERSKYPCPPTEFQFWTFILSAATFRARPVTVSEVREWLAVFGGVHLYENSLRVHPYGNPGNDWLDINLARVRSPEERPGTNNSIGRVLVHDTTEMLVQKTDRSGYIETPAFLAIRDFACDALDWLAKKRLELAEHRRQAKRTEAPRSKIREQKHLKNEIENLAIPKAQKKTLQQRVETYDRARDKEADALRADLQLYRTLATAGITAATFAHEVTGNPIKVMQSTLSSLLERVQKDIPDQKLRKKLVSRLELIDIATDSLATLGVAVLKLLDHQKRRPSRVDLNVVAERVKETFTPFFMVRKVKAEFSFAPGNPFLRGTEAAIESVLTNFINNSLWALEAVHESRKLVVSIETEGDVAFITVDDNGPGLELDEKEIWIPGQTSKPNGTGLGLTIVRDTVTDLSGDVSVDAHGPLGGARFRVELPILGK